MNITKTKVEVKDVRNIIRYKRLTVQKFADSVSVSRQTVHNWLNGGAISRQSKALIHSVYGETKLD